MTARECACSRPIGDAGAVCRTCARYLGDGLARLAGLVRELDVTASRQSRTGTGTGGGGRGARERALPYDPRAAAVRDSLGRGLLRLAGLSEDSTVDPALVARALAAPDSVRQLRMRADAPAVKDRVERWVDRAERAVDLPPDRDRWIGPCPSCGGDVYARLGAGGWADAVCRCGREVSVSERDGMVREAALDMLLPAHETAAALEANGVERVSAELVRSWASKGLVPKRRVAGRTVYPVREVHEYATKVSFRRGGRPRKNTAA